MYEEDEDDWTVPCPHCGEDIYDDVDQCPHCSMNIGAADFKKPWPTWVVILIVLTIVGFVLGAVSF